MISFFHFLILEVRFQFLLIITGNLFFPQILVVLALLQNELSQLRSVQFLLFELQSDRLTNDGLLLEVTHIREERMLQTGLKRNSVIRIKDENFLQEIDCFFRAARVFIFKFSTWCVGKLLEIL